MVLLPYVHHKKKMSGIFHRHAGKRAPRQHLPTDIYPPIIITQNTFEARDKSIVLGDLGERFHDMA